MYMCMLKLVCMCVCMSVYVYVVCMYVCMYMYILHIYGVSYRSFSKGNCQSFNFKESTIVHNHIMLDTYRL